MGPVFQVKRFLKSIKDRVMHAEAKRSQLCGKIFMLPFSFQDITFAYTMRSPGLPDNIWQHCPHNVPMAPGTT